MPERIELIHCQELGRITGIRLDSGAMLRTIPVIGSVNLHASESAVPYILGTVADAARVEAEDAAREDEATITEDHRREYEREQLRLENDVAYWKQRAADLASDLAELWERDV
jgi:hypothetical protein